MAKDDGAQDNGAGDGGAARITVLYNGECPICRREIVLYQGIVERTGAPVDWIDISVDLEALNAANLTQDQAARRLHVYDTDGTLLSGVAAFIRLWREVQGFGWLASLANFPLVRPFAFALYEWVLAPFLFWLHKRRQQRKGQ